MSQHQETEEGVHPSENAPCATHDSQTKAPRSEQLLRPDCPVLRRVKESDYSASEIDPELESTPWRSRLRSRSPILDFREKSTRIFLSEGQNFVRVQSDGSQGRTTIVKETLPPQTKRDKTVEEMHDGGVMETLLKHLPAATPVGLFTTSCLLLLPLILVLRRYA
ncbi:uncharacterized protein LOC144467034 [Epinephelus lanceolatus]